MSHAIIIDHFLLSPSVSTKACTYIFSHKFVWDLLQGMQMGIALPSFLLNIQGAASGAILLGLVGLGILLPLLIAVVYLSRSSKYTGNYVMHQTLQNYYYCMKQYLAPRCGFSPFVAL